MRDPLFYYNLEKANCITHILFDKKNEDVDNDKNVLNALNKSHIFLINKEVDQLCKYTKNKIYSRKLPFDVIYLGIPFNFNKCFVNGIIIYDGYYNKETKYSTSIDYILNPNNIVTRGIIIVIDIIKKNDFTENELTIGKRYDSSFYAESITNRHEGKFLTITQKELNSIWLYVCNFLDFLNNPDVETMLVERTKEQNQKRINRGQQPIPTQVFIRVKGQLKTYLDQIQSNPVSHLHYKFWVRGHFRTLRSERYKDKIGMKLWIPPFIKGKGMLVEKIYNVKGGEE